MKIAKKNWHNVQNCEVETIRFGEGDNLMVEVSLCVPPPLFHIDLKGKLDE